MTLKPKRCARWWIASISHGCPQKCTGTTTFGSVPACSAATSLRSSACGDQVVGARIDVDEIDLRAAIERAVGGGDEGDRGGPEPVAGAEAQRQAGDVQGRGGAVDRHGMRGPAIAGHALLEARHHRPLGQQVGAQHRNDGFDVVRGDSWRP